MGMWDEIFSLGTRSATKKRRSEPREKARKFTIEPSVARKLAKEPSAWDAALGEVGAFFKPAGVFGKNLADAVLDPAGSMRGETDGLTDFLKHARTFQDAEPRPGYLNERRANPFDAALQSETEDRLRLPSVDPAIEAFGRVRRGADRIADKTAMGYLPPVQAVRAALHPVDTWNRIFNGTNPGDGDRDAVWGSRTQELWNESIQPDVDRVSEMNRYKPIVSKLAEGTPAAQYFDENSADVFSAAQDAGFSGGDAIIASLLNPLEWLGAESNVSRAAKLAKAGPLRQAVNAAGSFMDPIQKTFDAAGGAARGFAKAVDWRLPGAKTASQSLDVEEAARRAGVKPEEMAHSMDWQAQQAAKQATHEAPPTRNEIDELLAEWMPEPVGEATATRIADLADEGIPYQEGVSHPDHWAGRIPDAYEAPAPFPREAPVAFDAPASQVEPPPIPKAEEIPFEYDAGVSPERYSPEADDLIKSLLDETLPADAAAPRSPGQIEEAALFDEAMRAADIQESVADLERFNAAKAATSEARVASALADATPGAIAAPSNDDLFREVLFGDTELPRMTGSLEDALRTADPGAASPVPNPPIDPLLAFGEPSRDAIDAALRATNGGGTVGQEASQAAALGRGSNGVMGVEAGPGVAGPVQNGTASMPVPGSSAVELVDDIAPPGAAASPRTLSGGLKLHSNPIGVWLEAGWNSMKDSGFIGRSMSALQSKIDNASGAFVEASPALRAARDGMKRIFSPNYGAVAAEEGARIAQFGMQRDAIIRTANDVVYEALKGGTETERKLLQQFMNGSLTAKNAMAAGLSPEKIQVGNIVRDLMDVAGAQKIATSLGLEREFLTQASMEEKHLYKQLYETFDGRQTNISRSGKGAKYPQESINLRRDQVLEAAKGVHSDEFILKAQNLIDGAMKRMEAQGFVKDGRVLDMGLDFGAYLANFGKYEPRLYKLMEYGVDISSPTAALDFVAAVEARENVAHEVLNGMREAQGLPPVPAPKIPDDLRRFLLTHQVGEGGWSAGVADEAARFLKRKDLSQEMRDILGPMVNPAYTYMKGVQHVHLAENLQKLRRWAASHAPLVSRHGETVEQFMARTGVKESDIAFDMAANPQYAAQLGALQGRFIHRDMADLLAVSGGIPHMHGASGIEHFKSLSRSALTLSKVILNPASHVRQFFQNATHVWNTLGWDALRGMYSSMADLKNKSRDYLEARNAGIFSSGHDPSFYEKVDLDKYPEYNFGGVEHSLAKIARSSQFYAAIGQQALNAWKATRGAASKVQSVAGDAFSWSDDLAKLAVFKHYRKQGLGVIDAAEKAKKNIYTGTGISRYDRAMGMMPISATFYDRGARLGAPSRAALNTVEGATALFGNPFFGVTRFLYENFYKNMAGVSADKWMPMTDPARAMRSYSALMLAYGIGELGKQHSGVEAEEESKRRPNYMRPLLPGNALIPPQMAQLVAGDGQSAWIDHSTMTPWGQATQGRWNPKKDKMSSFGDNLVDAFVPFGGLSSKMTGDGDGLPMNPMVKPLIELFAYNRDSFSDREIVPNSKDASLLRQGRAVTGHLVRSYLPPWAPNPAGLLAALEALPRNPMDAGEWGETFHAAVQGLAEDSGHQASKLISGAWNSMSDVAKRDAAQRIREAAYIQDYRGRNQHIVRALLDIFPVLGGSRIEVRANNEVAESVKLAKQRSVADMKSEFAQRTRNMRGKRLEEEKRQYNKSRQEILDGKPSLRWFEAPPDAIINAVNGIDAAIRKMGTQKGIEA